MNVLDALAFRRSVRTFAPRQPERATIESVLRNAARAPSAGNSQPWRVHLFAGDPLADLVNAAAAAEPLLAARLGGDDRRDAPESQDPAELRRAGLRFFEAPIGLVCTLGRNASEHEWMEHGGFVYGICIAAAEYNLATCIIGDFRLLEDVLAPFVATPGSDETISVGIGIGYQDTRASGRSDRHDLEAFATFSWD